MDNNLNLWSGIELTWENILARTFYGTDIYSHILQTYYPHDFLMHVKGDDCGWVRNPWDWSRPSLHIEIRKMDPKAKLPPRMAVHHDESRHIPDLVDHIDGVVQCLFGQQAIAADAGQRRFTTEFRHIIQNGRMIPDKCSDFILRPGGDPKRLNGVGNDIIVLAPGL